MKKNVLNVEDILLDSQNPRLKTIFESQTDALRELLDSSEEKILNLVIDIAENGLNPFENIGVLKEDDKFIVLEGNRRICALKLLKNPNIVKDINNKLYTKISKLKANISINKIEVIVFDDRKKANEWIKLIHTGENLGKGRVSWNTQNKRLFDLRNSKKLTQTQEFLNFFYKNTKLSEIVLDKLKDLKITNLERTLNDINVKETLGIRKDENDKYDFNNIDREIADKLMYDMLVRKPKVSEVYNKKNREDYIEKILEIQIPKNMTSEKININREDLYKTENTNSENKIAILSEKKEDNKNILSEKLVEKNQKSNTHTLTRNTLIPKNIILKIENPKLNNLYRELKKCSFNEYPSLIECSFRIFLELTVNEYNLKHGINFGNSTLEQKLKRIVEDIFIKGLIKESEKKNLILLLNENSIFSIKIQNSLVHTELSLDSTTIKKVWDQYQNLIIIMCDEINKKIEKKLAKQKKIC